MTSVIDSRLQSKLIFRVYGLVLTYGHYDVLYVTLVYNCTSTRTKIQVIYDLDEPQYQNLVIASEGGQVIKQSECLRRIQLAAGKRRYWSFLPTVLLHVLGLVCLRTVDEQKTARICRRASLRCHASFTKVEINKLGMFRDDPFDLD